MDTLVSLNGEWVRNYKPLGGDISLNGVTYDIRDVSGVYWDEAEEDSTEGYYDAKELVVTTKDSKDHSVHKGDLDSETLEYLNEWVDAN